MIAKNMITVALASMLVGLSMATYAKSGHYGAAVKSSHSINTYPVTSSRMVKNAMVDIDSGPLPITLRFNTYSSNIKAIQKHFASQGQVHKSSAVDDPDVLIQNIKKPVINDIREVISPYRSRTQEVRPVQEKIDTIIAKGKEGHYAKYPSGKHENHY